MTVLSYQQKANDYLLLKASYTYSEDQELPSKSAMNVALPSHIFLTYHVNLIKLLFIPTLYLSGDFPRSGRRQVSP